MFFVNGSTGWIVGSTGTIYKTTTGGDPLVHLKEGVNVQPDDYYLYQNYPNPFNPVTKINYSLAKNGYVTLRVYDILGRVITTLVNDVKEAGNYIIDFDASELSSGVYYYKLESGDYSQVRKMTVMK